MRVLLFLLFFMLSPVALSATCTGASCFTSGGGTTTTTTTTTPQPVSIVSPSPVPVYITAANPATDIEAGTFSQFLSQITLGDIWLLQFVVGLCQIAFLGAIHGHQR